MNTTRSTSIIDEFEDVEDDISLYVQYRIAGGRMKNKESDTGNELRYAQFQGIEFDESENGPRIATTSHHASGQ